MTIKDLFYGCENVNLKTRVFLFTQKEESKYYDGDTLNLRYLPMEFREVNRLFSDLKIEKFFIEEVEKTDFVNDIRVIYILLKV